MDNVLNIPFLNPIPFYAVGQPEIPAYLTKHFNNYNLEERWAQMPWESGGHYYQKWQTTDIINFQFESNYSPIQIDLINSNQEITDTILMANVLTSSQEPGFYIFEGAINLAGQEPGAYILKLTAGVDDETLTMLSEPMCLKEIHPNTIYHEYKNNRFREGVVFETGIKFGLRVEASIVNLQPGAQKTVYQDEPLNTKILDGKPFRVFDYIIGGSLGIPDWLLDIINRTWCLNEVQLDGKYFAVESDSPEPKREDNYALVGATYKVREGLNRNSRIITTTGGNVNQTLLVAYNIDSKLFGDIESNGSDDTVRIKSIE